jgi:hypothetical protein
MHVARKDPEAVTIGIIKKYDVVEKYQLKNENFNLKKNS